VLVARSFKGEEVSVGTISLIVVDLPRLAGTALEKAVKGEIWDDGRTRKGVAAIFFPSKIC
jgi:hypothetical protein